LLVKVANTAGMHIVKTVMPLKSKPLIGILTITLEPLEDSYHVYFELVEELTALDVELVVFTPYGINWLNETVRGFVFKNGTWDRGVTRFPDAVYNRLYGTNAKTIARLIKMLGEKCVFNHQNRLNKAQVARILNSSKLEPNLPETNEYSWDNLAGMLAKYEKVMLKPVYGHYGFNIYQVTQTESQYLVYFETLRRPHYRFNKPEQLRNWIEELLLRSHKCIYLVQQYIEPLKIRGRFFDLRVLVQRNAKGKWAVTAIMSRINRLNYLISNFVYSIADGTELLKDLGLPRLIDPITEMGIDVGRLLTKKMAMFAEISVDYLIDNNNKPWIIEVNGKPRKDLFEDYADEELLRTIHLQPIIYGRHAAVKKQNSQLQKR